MNQLSQIGLIFTLCFFMTSCNRQTKQSKVTSTNQPSVGGAFENSEFTYYGIPKTISSIDTSSGWKLNGQKILLTGIVYQIDGKTPANDVLLYYYQTDTEGKYLHKAEESRSMPPNGLGQTHGYIRGWVKTDKEGKYYIYTVRPGTYPTNDEPAHVHITVKEPNDIKEYYIDDFVFDDDVLMTTKKRIKMENRAGSGVVRLIKKDQLSIGERNIYLGLNIPKYPKGSASLGDNGKKQGEDILSFAPYHAWGLTKVRELVQYASMEGIMVFSILLAITLIGLKLKNG